MSRQRRYLWLAIVNGFLLLGAVGGLVALVAWYAPLVVVMHAVTFALLTLSAAIGLANAWAVYNQEDQ